MNRAFVAIVALSLSSPAWAQQPVPPSSPQPPMVANPPIRWLSPEQKAEIAAEEARRKAEAERKKAALFPTMPEKETACVAKAREKAALPALDKLTVLSGDTSKGREFVRLSWDPRDAPKVEYAAFECYFEQNELVSSKPDIDLIAK